MTEASLIMTHSSNPDAHSTLSEHLKPIKKKKAASGGELSISTTLQKKGD